MNHDDGRGSDARGVLYFIPFMLGGSRIGGLSLLRVEFILFLFCLMFGYDVYSFYQMH